MSVPSERDPEKSIAMISRWLIGLGIGLMIYSATITILKLPRLWTTSDLAEGFAVSTLPGSVLIVCAIFISKRSGWAVFAAMVALGLPHLSVQIAMIASPLLLLLYANDGDAIWIAAAIGTFGFSYGMHRFLKYLQQLLLEADKAIAKSEPRPARGFEPVKIKPVEETPEGDR